MKKNRIAGALVLFVILSCPAFSDQESCEGTHEYYFGLTDGRMRSAWGWDLLGFGLTTIGGIVSVMADFRGWYPPEANESWYLLGPGIGTAISIALPLVTKPQPKAIPANISEDQLECYLDGYGRSAKRKNTTGALIGSAVGWVCSLYVVPFFAFVFSFSSMGE